MGHGVHDYDRPQHSYIHLNDKTKLTLEQLYQLKELFDRYQSLILPNCESATMSSKSITTEYVGIASVLLSCGVQTVISPLWQIEEQFAILVLKGVNERIHQGQTTADALSQCVDYLCGLTYKEVIEEFEELQKQAHEQGLGEMAASISGHLEYLEKEASNNGKPFEHPYYRGAFVALGGITPAKLANSQQLTANSLRIYTTSECR